MTAARPVRLTIPAAVALVVLGGCSQGALAPTPSGTPQPQAATRLLVGHWKNGDDGMLALALGVLLVQQDGCVGLRRDGNGRRPTLLHWPAGTRLADDGKAVIGLSGKRLEFGQETGLGGGFGGAKLPDECDASRWGGVFEVQQPL